MSGRMGPARRAAACAILAMLAAAGGVAKKPPAPTEPPAQGDDDKPLPAASGPSVPAASGPAAPPKGILLTVHVKGADKPIANAEVRIIFAKGGSATLRTGSNGTAQVTAPVAGLTTVRVLAEGWNSGQSQIDLPRGKPSSMTIALTKSD